MITIQKLRDNLAESEKWHATFRQQIKQILGDISLKNESIITMVKTNADLKNDIQKRKQELKRLCQLSQKEEYRSTKIAIKMQQLQSRIKMYAQGLSKKESYNRQLKNKVLALQVDIEREKSILNEFAEETTDSNPDESRSNRSVVSVLSQEIVSFKSVSFREKVPIARYQIDQKLAKIKNIQKQHAELLDKNRRRVGEIERAKKIGERLREKLTIFHQEVSAAERLFELSIVDDAYGQSVAVKCEQLYSKNNELNQAIQVQQQFIQNFYESVVCLLFCDSISDDVRKSTMLLQREVKRQKCAMTAIGNYLTKESC